MIIMSQNRKSVMDCAKLKIEKNLSFGSGSKFAIVGTPKASALEGVEVLGEFADEKLAVAELERLMNAMSRGDMVNYIR